MKDTLKRSKKRINPKLVSISGIFNFKSSHKIKANLLSPFFNASSILPGWLDLRLCRGVCRNFPFEFGFKLIFVFKPDFCMFLFFRPFSVPFRTEKKRCSDLAVKPSRWNFFRKKTFFQPGSPLTAP